MRLTRREHSLFIGLTLLIAGWSTFVFAVRPAMDRVKTLRRVVPENKKDLQELRTKSSEYLTLKAELDDLKKTIDSREKGYEPITFLESAIRNCGLGEKTKTMEQEVSQLDTDYSRTIIQIDMKDLTFEQVVNFLLYINSSKQLLNVESLYTKKNTDKDDLLDTVIRISAITRNEQ